MRPLLGELPPMVQFEARHPFEHIAVELQGEIYRGKWPIGTAIPSVKTLAQERAVARSTIHRALHLLQEWGLVRVVPDRPTLVLPTTPAASRPSIDPASLPVEVHTVEAADRLDTQALELEVRRLGVHVATLRAKVAAQDDDSLHRLLIGAIKRQAGLVAEIEDYELIVRMPGAAEVLATYVALAP
jgi:DNA-binding transcriptional regulator YhcF (GntR family)